LLILNIIPKTACRIWGTLKTKTTSKITHMKHLKFLSLLFAATSLSSCLHFIEEITVRKDGSGFYRFVIDASEIQKMASDFGNTFSKSPQTDSTATKKTAPSGISNDHASDSIPPKGKEYEMAAAQLQTQLGIHNAIGFADSTTFQSGYSFDFDNLQCLKNAMLAFEKPMSLSSWDQKSAIGSENKTFRHTRGTESFRNLMTQALKERGEAEGRETAGAEGIMRLMFGSMTFKQVYHFPDQTIKKCNHPNARISDGQHTLSITEKPFGSEDQNQKNIPAELQVHLK
jgi:hypothetical protein